MKFVRFLLTNKQIRVGLVSEEMVYDITPLMPENVDSLTDLIKNHQVTVGLLAGKELNSLEKYSFTDLDTEPNEEQPYLITPFDPPEVWACGVTYLRSREAREFETQSKTIYDHIYEAERPELFIKGNAANSRVVGPNNWVGIRNDSTWMVPEPELGLVLDADSEIMGFVIGNDQSSRDIEGENPLYLPQAKIFKNCCSIGPMLVTKDEIRDSCNLNIACRIYRGGEKIFEDSANTSQLKRSYDELISFLKRDNVILPGTVLLTGTCIVPPNEFSLADGDLIEIEIDNLGLLRNVARNI